MKSLFAKTTLATLLAVALVGCDRNPSTPDAALEAIAAVESATTSETIISSEPEVVETVSTGLVETSDTDELPEWVGWDGVVEPYNLKGEKIEGAIYRGELGQTLFIIEEDGLNGIPSIIQRMNLDDKFRVLGDNTDTYINLYNTNGAEYAVLGTVEIRSPNKDVTCNVVYLFDRNDDGIYLNGVDLNVKCLDQ